MLTFPEVLPTTDAGIDQMMLVAYRQLSEVMRLPDFIVESADEKIVQLKWQMENQKKP